MAERKEYQMVGRYNKGNEITAYALTNTSDGTTKKYSKEQVVLLVGRGQVDKVDGQVYKDDVLLRGIGGFSINKLPTKVDIDAVENTDEASENLAGEPNPSTYFDVPPILRLDAVAKSGRSVIAYLVFNKMKNTSKALSRQKVIKLASEKKIENAYTQKDSRSEGGLLLRGLGCSLNDLRPMTPEEMEENGIKVKKKPVADKIPVESTDVVLAGLEAASTVAEPIVEPILTELDRYMADVDNILANNDLGKTFNKTKINRVKAPIKSIVNAYKGERQTMGLENLLVEALRVSDYSEGSVIQIRVDYSYNESTYLGGMFVATYDSEGNIECVESTAFTSREDNGGDPDYSEVYSCRSSSDIKEAVKETFTYIRSKEDDYNNQLRAAEEAKTIKIESLKNIVSLNAVGKTLDKDSIEKIMKTVGKLDTAFPFLVDKMGIGDIVNKELAKSTDESPDVKTFGIDIGYNGLGECSKLSGIFKMKFNRDGSMRSVTSEIKFNYSESKVPDYSMTFTKKENVGIQAIATKAAEFIKNHRDEILLKNTLV